LTRLLRWAALPLVFVTIALAAEEGKGAEPDMTGWKWANFAILAAGIGFLLVKQVGPFFAARSIEIRRGIEEAQKLRADAEARAAAMDAKLSKLSVEIDAMRKAAKDEAAQEDERIRVETERELAKIAANADHEIASALKAAQGELKRYSAQLAVELAGRKVRERMTSADQAALVEQFVTDLGRQGAKS